MTSGLAQDTHKTSSDLKNRIISCLSQRGVSRRLDIEVQDGTVTLRGTVPSFYQRQLCLCCKYVPGVRAVVDELRVEMPAALPKHNASAVV